MLARHIEIDRCCARAAPARVQDSSSRKSHATVCFIRVSRSHMHEAQNLHHSSLAGGEHVLCILCGAGDLVPSDAYSLSLTHKSPAQPLLTLTSRFHCRATRLSATRHGRPGQGQHASTHRPSRRIIRSIARRSSVDTPVKSQAVPLAPASPHPRVAAGASSMRPRLQSCRRPPAHPFPASPSLRQPANAT